MHNINLINPLNPTHWMTRDCCIWLKAVNSHRSYTYYDLTHYRNHIPLFSRGVTGGYPWETGKGRGLPLNTNHFKSNLVTIPGMPTGSADRTVMFWYKQEIANVYAEILQIGGVNAAAARFSPYIDGSDFYIEGAGISASMVHVPDSNWHMFAATLNGARFYNIKMYLDGVLQSTYYSGGNYVVKTNNQLGIANLVGYGYDFYGLLDDIRIYNRALSDHEVMTIYRDSVNAEYTAINRSDDDTSKITGARYLSMIWPKHRSMLHGRGCGL